MICDLNHTWVKLKKEFNAAKFDLNSESKLSQTFKHGKKRVLNGVWT